MAFFTSLADAIAFVGATVCSAGVRPRCLELFDDGSLDMIRPQAGQLGIPLEARAGIFFEEECRPEEADDVFERSAELRRQMPRRHEDQSDHSIQHRRAPQAPGQGRGLCVRSAVYASRRPSNLSKSWLAFGLCE